MQMKRRVFFENIEDIILILLFTYTSLNGMSRLFQISFVDELLVICLLCTAIAKKGQVRFDKTAKLLIAYIVYALAITIFNLSSIMGFVEALPLTIKIPLVFFTFSQIDIPDERRNKLLKVFCLANIPSIYRGIWQFRHRSLGWSLGLKMRNGTVRITGYAGHPIWFAFSMIVIAIIVVFVFQFCSKHKNINRLVKAVIVSTLVFLIIASQTRYALAVLLLIVYLWVLFILQRKKIRLKIAVTFFLITLGVLTAMIFGWSVLEEILHSTDSTAVRTQGFLAIPKAMYNYPFGSGLGTFGNKSSVLYQSRVYAVLGMPIPLLDSSFNSGNIFESMFVQRMVETGLVGTIIYMLIFLHPLKWYKKSADDVSTLILLVFFFNSVMNVAYQLPLIVVAGIAFSNLLYNKNYAEK